jgi:hypothetical protein
MEPMDVGPKYGGHLQITEVDRQQALSLIEAAKAQGYLGSDEYEHRALAIRSATLYDDLRPVTRDLSNVTYAPVVYSRAPVAVPGAPTSQVRVGFFSGSKLAGRWTVPDHFRLFAVFGGLELDFTDAVWTSDELVIDNVAVFGGMTIRVPDGVDVVDNTFAIFGGTDIKRVNPAPGGKRIILRGMAVFGGIEAKGPKPLKG